MHDAAQFTETGLRLLGPVQDKRGKVGGELLHILVLIQLNDSLCQ